MAKHKDLDVLVGVQHPAQPNDLDETNDHPVQERQPHEPILALPASCLLRGRRVCAPFRGSRLPASDASPTIARTAQQHRPGDPAMLSK